MAVWVGLVGGAMVSLAAGLIWLFGSSTFDGYCKKKVERTFAEMFPGCSLQIGAWAYSPRGDRLVAESVTMNSALATVRVGWMAATGVRLWPLLSGDATLAGLLVQASLEATNLSVDINQTPYGVRCARLRMSVPGSELIAEGTEFGPQVGDEELFDRDVFRTTRYRVIVPECRIAGLAYDALFQGTAYRARSIHVSEPSFDALVNGDKPARPHVKPPLMVHEALAAILRPMQVDRLTIADGQLNYGERAFVGADPGVLTVGAVSLTVVGLANRVQATPAISLLAQGLLMKAGLFKVAMSIPIAPATFSMQYSGSLSAMDLTRLDPFMVVAAHTQIKSGRAQAASFDVEVTAGHARGSVRAIYEDLELTILDRLTGSANGLDNRVASFLANVLRIRNANAPDAAGSMKVGKVDYIRGPQDEFLQFAWLALRSGVVDVISH